MSLKLTLVRNHQRLSSDQEVAKVIEHGSITIGRESENDWVLPDPDRLLSSKHCIIQVREGSYFITDTSKNGVFINDSKQCLGTGRTTELNDGDHLKMGKYEIAVRVNSSVKDGSDIRVEQHLKDIPAGHLGILNIIEEASKKVDRRVISYRRSDSYLIIGNLIVSTLATMLAGGMATPGLEIADKVGGWQIGCSFVAGLTALTTISSVVHKQLKISDHLTKTVDCSAQLNALKFSLEVAGSDVNDVKKQYVKILQEYSYYITR